MSIINFDIAMKYNVNLLSTILLLRKSVPIVIFICLMNMVIIMVLIETYILYYYKQNCFSFSREINVYLNCGDCVVVIFPWSCTR